MIVITLGDPGGISYEIFLKSQKLVKKDDIVIGSFNALKFYSERLSLNLPLKMNFYDIKGKFIIGKDSPLNGEIAFRSLMDGIQILKQREAKAIITLPLSKNGINLAGYKFLGQTEIIADAFNVKDYGMLMIGKINVFLLTTHIPLKDVHRYIKKEFIKRKVKIMNRFFLERFKIKPRILFLSLNPHSGESGILGKEEINEIIPAMNELKKEGLKIKGIVPPDTFFLKNDYDVIVAMYHDQGMIPFKYTSFYKGINTTVGLPIVRTSPAHGVGFDIVCKNIASPESTKMAIKITRKIC